MQKWSQSIDTKWQGERTKKILGENHVEISHIDVNNVQLLALTLSLY